ncbi:MAG TPA: hypothetical protein ENJ61_01865, partial [Aquifex aeolicus]|nr:hypothetical protein [Aquifex aeolicus]
MTVRIPIRALARAASMPACPPPMTATSNSSTTIRSLKYKTYSRISCGGMKDIRDLVERYLRGGYEYEIFLQRIRKLQIETSGESPENISTSEESGVGLRVLKDGRIGFAYTTSLEEDSLRDVVEKASEMCDLQNPDRGNVFIGELKN